MKVKLLARKGANKPGTVIDISTASAEFMIRQGYAEAVKDEKKETPENKGGHTETVLGTGSEDTPKPAARRGRPKKGE